MGRMVAPRAWVLIGGVFSPGAARTIGSLKEGKRHQKRADGLWYCASRDSHGIVGRRTVLRYTHGTILGPRERISDRVIEA